MRILIGALAVALLAGCSTPSMTDMRAKGPAKTYSSVKKEDVLSKCILFAWQDGELSGGGMPMGMQPGRSAGPSVYAGNREYFADVSDTSAGASVKYYEVGNTWGSKILRSELEACL
jgi:hypothetical protein